jgi:GNAT superfamily N-acetyltransferase
MPDTGIRLARPEDAESIAVVHVRSRQAAYAGMMPQDLLDGLDVAARTGLWQRVLREAGQPGTGVVVAESGADLLGFVHFCPTRDADQDPARVGEVSSIYLLPQAWAKGLGWRLMAGAVRHLTDAGYAEALLWVLDTNARARRFYTRADWAENGATRHEDLRGFPITEVRYRRQLSGAAIRAAPAPPRPGPA